MRKVLFKKWIPIQYIEKESIGILSGRVRVPNTGCWADDFSEEGLFHCWSQSYEELNNGVGNYSVALVEISNGEIVEVLPSNLKFADKPVLF